MAANAQSVVVDEGFAEQLESVRATFVAGTVLLRGPLLHQQLVGCVADLQPYALALQPIRHPEVALYFGDLGDGFWLPRTSRLETFEAMSTREWVPRIYQHREDFSAPISESEKAQR